MGEICNKKGTPKRRKKRRKTKGHSTRYLKVDKMSPASPALPYVHPITLACGFNASKI